jgi:hypothetical protein
VKGEKSPQEIEDQKNKDADRQDLKNMVEKMRSAIESKYGPHNHFESGAYCWFFGHKKITIDNSADITYTYIPAARSQASFKSDL